MQQKLEYNSVQLCISLTKMKICFILRSTLNYMQCVVRIPFTYCYYRQKILCVHHLFVLNKKKLKDLHLQVLRANVFLGRLEKSKPQRPTAITKLSTLLTFNSSQRQPMNAPDVTTTTMYITFKKKPVPRTGFYFRILYWLKGCWSYDVPVWNA